MSKTIKITEIFHSLQGESCFVGFPTVFIRLTGCPLRCHYCDTAYAFSGGQSKSIDEILQEVAAFATRHVTVTGGEPLAQSPCIDLLQRLTQQGFIVSLETSGALDIANVNSKVIKVVDFKTPDSGEMHRNQHSNIAYLNRADQVKFVICSDDDYLWSKQFIDEHRLTDKCEVLFSPAMGRYDATQLADKILADNLAVRFQIQLHKYLWGDVAGK